MCSSVSPSITVPKSNSIGHASLPGASTTAWPPICVAPISKLVRVRREGLKNTRAMLLPAICWPNFEALKAAASSSTASSSARDQSWVFRKCFIGGDSKEANQGMWNSETQNANAQH